MMLEIETRVKTIDVALTQRTPPVDTNSLVRILSFILVISH